ncbi:MAG TPA: hypothetical protein PLI09_26260 [Candidatus Hydrogenedentes bacterium]|mgnify:CR=1 FL=1|nr:hypothetical protein [Candidatus Hydrogenedentota bacterium]
MTKGMVVTGLSLSMLWMAASWGAPVVFNDAGLLDAVRSGYLDQVGVALSDPPEDTELSNALFTEVWAPDRGISDLTGLQACAALETLYLARNAISDLAPISGLTSLRVLELGFGNPKLESTLDIMLLETNLVDDADMAQLAGLFSLQSLGIGGNLGITTLAVLGNFPVLQTLIAGGGYITDFSSLSGLVNLQYLMLVNSGFSDADVPYIQDKTALTGLFIGLEPGLSDISALTGLVHLEEASFPYTDVSNISVFSNWPDLDYVLMNNAPVSDLSGLSGLTHLTTAIFNNCLVTDISGLTGLTSLLALDLSHNEVSDITSLSTATGLAQLSLLDNLITDIQPLVDNAGIGGSDVVDVRGNPLSRDARCTQLPALQAKFTPSGYLAADASCEALLILHADGPGDVTPHPGFTFWPDDSTVTLKAYPASGTGYAFSGWSGDLVSSENEETLMMDSDKEVTAEFVPGDYVLTLQFSGTGYGAVRPFPSGGMYAYRSGQVAILAAVADTGNFFAGWAGDASGCNPYLNVVMDADKTISASFSDTGYTLTMNAPVGEGTTDFPPGSYALAAGAEITITALPSPGWRLAEWQGDYGPADPENPVITVTMNQHRTLTPVFELIPFILTVAISGGGTTDPEPGAHEYAPDTPVTVTASNTPCWVFDHWEGDLGGNDPQSATLNLTMNQEYSVSAVFVRTCYLLMLAAQGDGTTLPAAGVSEQPLDGQVEVAAIPNSPAVAFDHWEGDIGDNDPLLDIISLLMNQDRSVMAVFSPADVVLSLASSGPGTTEPVPGEYGFLLGRVVNISAVPDMDAFFSGWTGDVQSLNLSLDLVMDASKSLAAHFSDVSYQVTIEVSGTGATDPAPGVYTLGGGAMLPIAAIADDPGWLFDHWEGDIGAVDPSNPNIILLVDQNRVVTAVFVAIEGENEGSVEGEGEGPSEGEGEGYSEGMIEGLVEGEGEGMAEGVEEGAVEGLTEGEEEGEGSVEGGEEGEDPWHSADQNHDGLILLSELLRVIQFFNSDGYHCQQGGEDGYAPGPSEAHECVPHDSDYNPQDWEIGLSELLRVIQFFNSGGCHYCPEQGTEDGFCVGRV